MNFYYLFLVSVCIALVLSCKEKDNFEHNFTQPVNQISSTVPSIYRDTLATIKLSIEAKDKWIYNSKSSQLLESEQVHYLKKLTFEKANQKEGFKTLSYTLAKDGVTLSLEGGLEGALLNMIASSQSKLIQREDRKMDSIYGFPSLYSKGKLVANSSERVEISYRLLLLIHQSELYFVLGLFTNEDSVTLQEFENELYSIKILSTTNL